MKNKENERYVKLGITLSVVAVVAMISYFFIVSLGKNGGAIGKVLSIIKPFLWGVAIAYIVTPLCRRLERVFKGWFRGKRDKLASMLAITISVVLEILVILAVVFLIVPQLVSSIAGLAETLPSQVVVAREKLELLLQDPPEWLAWVQDYFGDLNKMVDDWLKNDLPRLIRTSLAAAAPRLAGTFGVIYNLLLGQIVAFYLLARRGQLAAQARLVLRGTLKTSWADWLEAEARVVDHMFNGFFMGKLLDSAIIGLLCFIGSVAMGFGSPVLIAVIVGVTNIIPFFGPFIGAIPCALLLLLEEPMHCLMFVIFVIVLQQLDGNVIGPRILGNTTGLSGLWVMFGILLFGGLWGVAGMIIGVPLMAVIYDVIRQLTAYGVRKHGRDDILDAYNAEYHPKK